MSDEPERPPCGVCFKTCGPVAEEVFDDDVVAFIRYANLARQGKSPALCHEGGRLFFVCHQDPFAGKKTTP